MAVAALSNSDIQHLTDRFGLHVTIVMYHDIKHHSEDLVNMLPVVILYELNYPIGHWVAIFQNNQGLQYFDPTGKEPDELLIKHFKNPLGRKKLNADYTYLLSWMDDNFNEIIYNEIALQPPDTNTCGYWVGVRLVFYELSQEDFANAFSNFTDDERQKCIVQLFNFLSGLDE